MSKDSQLIMRRGQSLAVACAVNPWEPWGDVQGCLIDMQPSRASAAGAFLAGGGGAFGPAKKSLNDAFAEKQVSYAHAHDYISFVDLAAIDTPYSIFSVDMDKTILRYSNQRELYSQFQKTPNITNR